MQRVVNLELGYGSGVGVPERSKRRASRAQPAPLRALIRKCWAQDPAERPTAAEAAEALRRIERDASASSGAGLWHGSLQPRRPTPSVAAVASALTARVAEALLMAWRAIVRFCQGTQTQASRGRYERIEQVAEAV